MPEPQRILLVEDDPDIVELLCRAFRASGFHVAANTTGERFIDQLSSERPDLLVLDLMLPATDGLLLLRELRRQPQFSALPVIVLTARSAELDRVRGLDLGADDYISKPFSTAELLARVRARLRGRSQPVQLLQAGDLIVNVLARTATLAGEPIELSETEFRMLVFFMRSPGTAFTRRQIIDAVWSPEHFITERAVDVYVLRLRSKIEPDPSNPRYLVAARGLGYRFQQ